MGRTLSFLERMAREGEKANRQRERERIRLEKETFRLNAFKQKETIRVNALEQKAAAAHYLASRVAETDELNKENNSILDSQHSLLSEGIPDKFVYDLSKITGLQDAKVFIPPLALAKAANPPSKEIFQSTIPQFSKIALFLPGNKEKLKKATQQADNEFDVAMKIYQTNESARLLKLDRLKEEHQARYKLLEDKIITLRKNYDNGDPHAITEYLTFVLDQFDFVDDFEEIYRLAYVPESKELVIEFELPNIQIVPTVAEHRYNKTRDQIESRARKETEIKCDYSDLISALCLLVIFYLFEADTSNFVEVVAFNGYVKTVDLATGKDIRPYLISVRTTKNSFSDLDLLRVDKKTCLRNLGAHVSPKPGEMQPIKPIVDFSMVDKRFVEQNDVVDSLDGRPNLMELNPFEFENLVSNLFTKMGLETKQTRSSKDGGVDAIAYDQRPILGGKVIIQAKRYKNTVGVAFVRDLFGTMMSEGANKGILVTTSGYGPDAFEFAKNKPIELIDGGGLLYLLNQVGIDAKIIFIDEIA